MLRATSFAHRHQHARGTTMGRRRQRTPALSTSLASDQHLCHDCLAQPSPPLQNPYHNSLAQGSPPPPRSRLAPPPRISPTPQAQQPGSSIASLPKPPQQHSMTRVPSPTPLLQQLGSSVVPPYDGHGKNGVGECPERASTDHRGVANPETQKQRRKGAGSGTSQARYFHFRQ